MEESAFAQDPISVVAAWLHRLVFACVSAVLLLSPWTFSSWEMWWFWPMVAVLFLACFFSGTAVLLPIFFGAPHHSHRHSSGHSLPPALCLTVLFIPFLLYAFVRAGYASAPGSPLVAMEAERSLLLFTTPILLGLILFFSSTPARRRFLVPALLVNTAVQAVYGLTSFFVFGGKRVLWVEDLYFLEKGNRLLGSFYCANYFSAFMNIALCVFLAILLCSSISKRAKILSALAIPLLLAANFFTLSRGGIGSLVLGLGLAIPLVAFRGRRLWVRLVAPVLMLLLLGTAILAIRYTDNPFMQRAERHPLWIAWMKSESVSDYLPKIHDAFWYQFDRGTYIDSALRAWRTNPAWGIGPGQHSNRWQQFAPTDDGVRPVDGDPATMKKPRLLNDTYHLYEVHSDWTQLLEEYGVVGILLFAIPFIGGFVLLAIRQGRGLRSDEPGVLRALPLAALLSAAILTVHSLFDFSFQIPCITWSFAALVTLALIPGQTESESNEDSGRS